MAGLRLDPGVLEPDVVDLRGVLADESDRLVVVESLDPVEALLHVRRPVLHLAAPDQGRDLGHVLDALALQLRIDGQPYDPVDVRLLLRRMYVLPVLPLKRVGVCQIGSGVAHL